MIKDLFKGFGYVLRYLLMGIKYTIKGISWYLKQVLDIFGSYREKRTEAPKKEEIL